MKARYVFFFFFSSRRRHTRSDRDWSSDVCSSDLADDRDMLGGPDHKTHRIDDPALVVLGERQIGNGHFAGQPRNGLGLIEQQPGIDHAGRLKLLDDLLVGDPRIFLDLVEVEQLLPRRGHLFDRGDDRHQRAQRQRAADDQIATQREKEKRRQLTDEIVKKFREKFPAKDLKPDIVDYAEDIGKIGQLQLDRVVGMDLDDTSRRFLYPVGNLTHRAHPALAQLVYLGLQLGNDVALHRIECDRADAKERVLREHEKDDHQQLTALEQRLVEGIANKTAQLLAFDGDHR